MIPGWKDSPDWTGIAAAQLRGQYIAVLSVPPIIVIILLAYSVPRGWPNGLITFGLGFGTSMTSGATGSLVGFLFGVPVRGTSGPRDPDSGVPYRGNTSLEQISDWLVKILVGVGLVQLTTLGPVLGEIFHEIGEALGGGSQAVLLAATMVIVSAIWGFLFAYLATRTSLPQLLSASEATEEVEKLDLRVERLERLVADQATPDVDHRGPA